MNEYQGFNLKPDDEKTYARNQLTQISQQIQELKKQEQFYLEKLKNENSKKIEIKNKNITNNDDEFIQRDTLSLLDFIVDPHWSQKQKLGLKRLRKSKSVKEISQINELSLDSLIFEQENKNQLKLTNKEKKVLQKVIIIIPKYCRQITINISEKFWFEKK